MEEKASYRNNVPMLFLHLSVAPTGGVGGQVARSPRRSLDTTRFVSGGRRLAPSRVAVLSATIVVFVVLQLGVRMTARGGVPLLRLHLMKLTASGSGDHEEDPGRVPQSLGLVACSGPIHRLKKHPMRRCSPRSWYGGYSPFFSVRPWWRRTMTVGDVLARHKFL
jgi:hypothetical protein